MNGFRAELFDKLLKFNPHIIVQSISNEELSIPKITEFFSERKIEENIRELEQPLMMRLAKPLTKRQK